MKWVFLVTFFGILLAIPELPKRTMEYLHRQVLVEEGEVLVLGGFVRTTKEPVFSEISALNQVPVAGPLLNRAITYPTRKRSYEVVVFIRPTVLPAPNALKSDVPAGVERAVRNQ